MKNFVRFMCLLLTLLAFKINANALSCTTEEITALNTEVATIKATVENVHDTISKTTYIDDYGNEQFDEDYIVRFNVKIINLSDNFYIKLHNDFDNKTTIYHASDAKDGVIIYKWDNIEELVKLKIDVYTSNKTACPDQKLYTISKTIPKYNPFYDTGYCDRNKESKYCSEYITFDISEETFKKLVEQEKKEAVKVSNKVAEKEQKIIKNKKMKKNMTYVAGGLLAVILLISLIIYVVKQRRSSL